MSNPDEYQLVHVAFWQPCGKESYHDVFSSYVYIGKPKHTWSFFNNHYHYHYYYYHYHCNYYDYYYYCYYFYSSSSHYYYCHYCYYEYYYYFFFKMYHIFNACCWDMSDDKLEHDPNGSSKDFPAVIPTELHELPAGTLASGTGI